MCSSVFCPVGTRFVSLSVINPPVAGIFRVFG
jgi:hypothetical protein